jgi:uncharacterized membrane protein
MVGLSILPSGIESHALAVSADRNVVVGFIYSASGYEASFWDAAHGMRNLKSVLTTEFGLDLTGWTLAEATGVSADGKVIVGHGVNPQGKREAWRAELPGSGAAQARTRLLWRHADGRASV